MKNRLLFLLLAFVILCSPALADGRVILLSWDGAADWVMDRLLAEGQMPAASRMAESGVKAEYMTTSFPSKTAAAHASIWTGAFGNVNGITGNRVPLLPKSEHTFTDVTSGFLAESLTAEPIWISVARQGKRVAVLQATQTEPADVISKKLDALNIPRERVYAATGYTYPISSSKVYDSLSDWKPSESFAARTLSFKIGDTGFTVTVLDSDADAARGYDTVLIQPAGSDEKIELKPAPASSISIRNFSPPIAVTKDGRTGYVRFRLFELSPDGSRFLLYQTAANSLDSTQPAQAEKVLAAAGGFYDDEFSVYSQGKLGKPIFEGGDGTAEKRLLELVRLDVEKLKLGTLYAMKNLSYDLMIHYSPFIDSAGHAWVGVLDPESPAYDAEVAAKLWPFYCEVWKLHDQWLDAVMKAAPQDAVVILVSDHGMEGASKWFYVNRLLEKVGIARLNSDGSVDVSSSKAAAVGEGNAIYINTTDHKGGIVPPEQKEAVMEEVTRVLLSATDPVNGRSIVTKVFRADDAPDVGTGGVRGADIIIDTAIGYDARESGGAAGVILQDIEPIGMGVHGGFPYEPRMRAIFFASGKGTAKGRSIPPLRTIDVAPTVSYLLGIASPRDTVGSPTVGILNR